MRNEFIFTAYNLYNKFSAKEIDSIAKLYELNLKMLYAKKSSVLFSSILDEEEIVYRYNLSTTDQFRLAEKLTENHLNQMLLNQQLKSSPSFFEILWAAYERNKISDQQLIDIINSDYIQNLFKKENFFLTLLKNSGPTVLLGIPSISAIALPAVIIYQVFENMKKEKKNASSKTYIIH